MRIILDRKLINFVADNLPFVSEERLLRIFGGQYYKTSWSLNDIQEELDELVKMGYLIRDTYELLSDHQPAYYLTKKGWEWYIMRG